MRRSSLNGLTCPGRFLLAALLTALTAGDARSTPPPVERTGDAGLKARALAGPLGEAGAIVFCTRLPYDDGHWYANIGYYCDDSSKKAYPANGRQDSSTLLRLDARTGRVATILDAGGGTIRDPQVHYGGRKVLFSYRKAGTDAFNLHEVELDGSGLRQITSGPFDDYEAVYLPDGDIAFVSTRCNRWVNCWMTQVGVLYRCGPDGSDIRPISGNTEHDNTPWVLPDGRLLYTRWEYVDRSQVEFHHLWVMNPDGTGQTVFYGNMRPHILMIDAKPVPGTSSVIASFSPGHGVNEHAGHATLVSPEAGPDEPSAARRLHGGKLTRDPYALAHDLFVAAREREIVLLDAQGALEVLHRHDGPGAVHEPRPVRPRPREPVIPARGRGPSSSALAALAASATGTATASATGTMVLVDAYHGRSLEGVRRGDIKKLLVLESLPKPVNFSGGPDLTSWLGTFTLERVLGTVPVEEDGSACFEVPAQRQLFFVALDGDDLSVKRMQSFASVMPGEVLSCAGCHEPRTRAPVGAAGTLQALRRPPSRIELFAGHPDVLDYHRDVQPILDRLCVSCHGYARREGKVILEGDLGPTWAHGYFSLLAHRQVADGRNGLGNQPPRTIGSSASALLRKLDGSHHDVRASPEDWRRLWLWIESGAVYAGTYAALRNEATQARTHQAMVTVLQGSADVLGSRCASCHAQGSPIAIPFHDDSSEERRRRARRPTGTHERIVFADDPIARFSPNILINFTRPRLSPLLLGPLAREAGGFGSCGQVFADAEDPGYQRILAAIEAGKAKLDVEPRFGAPGFQPNAQYVRELTRYGVLPGGFDLAGEAIDPFRLDQEYWRSLWR